MSKYDDRLALDLECRLTLAVRTGCDCFPYFVTRRAVLLPEVLKLAAKRKMDPVDLFADYARKVHARHESGLSLAVA